MNCTFGEILKSERKKRGWTRVQLYVRANMLSTKNVQLVSIRSLINYETNKTLPDIDTTVLLARVYNRSDLIALRAAKVELAKRKKVAV